MGNGYSQLTDPDDIDTDNDGYSDKLEYWVKCYEQGTNTLNSYVSWVTIVEIGGTGLSTSIGADSATVTLYQDSSYGTYYNVRYDDTIEQWVVRDQTYHDGWTVFAIYIK